MKCEACNAPKEIKDTCGCALSRLHNAFEDFKRDICGSFKINYKPKYYCSVEDWFESFKEESNR